MPVLACTTGLLMVISTALGLLFCCERKKGKKEFKGLGKVAYNASSGMRLGEEEGNSPSSTIVHMQMTLIHDVNPSQLGEAQR